MSCPYCNGSGKLLAVAMNPYINKKKSFSVPCVCFTSSTVSLEQKLLHHLGGQYMHPDKLDPRLAVNFDDLGANENIIITGNYDAMLLMVKAFLMKYRFDPRNIRILFSRSIDIVHEFHVPEDDGSSLHLSATSNFDLVIIVFGSNEKNKALAPCMTQIVQTRLEEKKPTWIYFPETMPALTPTNQEFSPEIVVLLDKKFKTIEIKSDMKIEVGQSSSKQSVKRF